MTPPEQTGAPVYGFSRPQIAPGEVGYAIIVAFYPLLVPRWRREAVPGVDLPMYEGNRVVGHGVVSWQLECPMPLSAEYQARFDRWLEPGASQPV